MAFPGVAAYNATQDSYFTTQEADLSPACIVVPTTPQDVAEAVKIMSGIESCHFAIKGQSHTPAAGFANINGGVTLDMTSLKLVTVNANHTVASIGGGASWLEVYSYLDTLGLTVPGGRNGAVGVGGLTLGGGISYWAPRVGWTCDNVVNFEVSLLYVFQLGLQLTPLDCPCIWRAHQCECKFSTRPLPCLERRLQQFWRGYPIRYLNHRSRTNTCWQRGQPNLRS